MVQCSDTFLISGQITQHDTTINIKLNRNESQNYQNKTHIVINQKYLEKKKTWTRNVEKITGFDGCQEVLASSDIN